MSEPTSWRAWRRRPWATFGLVLVGALVLAGLEHCQVERRIARDTPGVGASWIWAQGEGQTRRPEPAAFLAVADAALRHAPQRARLMVTADEQYHVHVNGRWIGANRFRPGTTFDTYDVAAYLTAGRNRVVVELFSRRGVGGLLAVLEVDDAPEPVLVSDDRWRIVRQANPGLYRPSTPLTGGEAPQVWGAPPTGRWRTVETTLRPALVPPSGRAPVSQPRQARCAASDCMWVRIDRRATRLPSSAQTAATLFDWGRAVVGYPVLDLSGLDASTNERALLATADDPGDLHAATQELVQPIEGAQFWHSAQPRRFRFLRVLGRTLARPPQVLVLAPEQAATLPAPLAPWQGVFGLEPLDLGPDSIAAAIVRRTQGTP